MTAPTPTNATSFERSTLLGTLESIQLPTGGRIELQYEPHQFQAPLGQTQLPSNSADYTGPGVRVRSISWTEPGSGITQRREYRYTASNGTTSSGRLLWQPCFMFIRPFSTEKIFSVNDVANHTFEERNVGYGRVTEVTAGRGQTVTTFALDGSAEDIAANASGSAGNAPNSQLPAWQRSIVGTARLAASCADFPSNSTYIPGYDTYPFPPSTNYDFWRGTPLSVVSLAEPAGSAAAAVVRRTDYTYTFRNLAPANAAPVVGWSYDGVSNTPVSATSSRAFVMARYELITEFQIAQKQESTKVYDPGTSSTGVTSSIGYAYNARGQLAGVARTNSNGSVMRTRYKYIADYNIPANPGGSDPNLQALAYRLHQEHLTDDLVETITEVVPAGTSGARLLGVTQATFRLTGTAPDQRTRPYQALQWKVNASPVPTQNPTDTTKVVGTTWQLSTRFRAESTIEEVAGGARQLPVTVSKRAGNTISSTHLGYTLRLPVLQLSNAYASEARFSNFEESSLGDLVYAWELSATGNAPTNAAARTGTQGLHITGPTTLSTVLPAPATGTQLPPAALGIRVSFWVRAAAAVQLAVQLARTTTPSVVFTKAVTVPASTGTGPTAWRLVEVPISGLASLGVTAANHDDFTVSVVNATTGQTFDIDDVLLIPSTASARSMTYEPRWGKTSETNERGQTTYYDYSPSGRLQASRDHLGNLVQYADQVINGHSADEAHIDFDFTSDNPASVANSFVYEGDVVTFTPRGLCEREASEVVRLGWTV